MEKLKAENDALRQELYLVKNKLQIANKTSTHLSDELEQLVTKSNREIDKYVTHLKRQEALVEKLTKKLEEQQTEQPQCQPVVFPVPEHLEATLRMVQEKSLRAKQDWEEEEKLYQTEIEQLQQKLTSADRELSSAVWKVAELNEEVSMLQELLASKKGNLLIKVQEMEELRELLEASQQQNGMLSAELAGLRSDSSNALRKGNSLFGEVADHRRKLMTTITQLKKSYSLLKSEHEDCLREIRQLRMAHVDSLKQYEQCIKLVRSAEHYNVQALRELNKDLNEQVAHVCGLMRYLENELATSGADWMNKLVAFYKNERLKLEISLQSYQYKYRDALELHQDAVKDAWKWRLEAQRLKLKVMNIEVPPSPADLSENGQPSTSDIKANDTNSLCRSDTEHQENGTKCKETVTACTPGQPVKTVTADITGQPVETVTVCTTGLPLETASSTTCKSDTLGNGVAGAVPLQENTQNQESSMIKAKIVPLKCYKISDLIEMRKAEKCNSTGSKPEG